MTHRIPERRTLAAEPRSRLDIDLAYADQLRRQLIHSRRMGDAVMVARLIRQLNRLEGD